MAELPIKCISARPTPPHTNSMESGPENTFSAQNRKKNQTIHEFRPKKGEGHFFDIFERPPTPPQPPLLPQNLKNVGFKLGGSWGAQTKNSLGNEFIGQNNDFTTGETNNSTPWGRVRE